MQIARVPQTTAGKILQAAGLACVLTWGAFGLPAGALGFTLFFSGAYLLFRKTSATERFARASSWTLQLLLANTAFFSSVKIAPFLEVSLLTYVILVGQLLLSSLPLQRRQAGKVLPVLMAFFLAAVAVSAISAESHKEVLYFFGFNLLAFAVFLSLRGRFDSQSAESLAGGFVSLGAVSALLAVWQLYTDSFKQFWYHLISGRDQQILELWEVVSRVVGTWQHPSYLGMYLAACLPLGAYLLFSPRQKTVFRRFWWGFGILACASVLLLTNTRSSVIAGAMGVVVYLIIVRFSSGRPFILARQLAALGLLAAAALSVYQFVLVSEIYTKPQAYRVDASATIWGRFLRSDSMSTESLVQRSQLWSLAWTTFLEHPVTGIGAKNFQYAVAERFGQGTDAHNLGLQTLAETGMLGFAAAAALYAGLLIVLIRSLRRRQTDDLALRAALFSIILLFIFDSLFNNPFYSLRLTLLFWLIAGLVQTADKSFNSHAENLHQSARV